MRALDFALILLVVGGAVALALVLRSAAFELRARLYRILAGLSLGLVVAGALCIVLQGALAGGFGLQEAFRWDTVDSVLQTRFGKAFLWQLGLAVVIAPAAFLASRSKKSSVGWLVLVPALLLLPTISAAGHARTSGTYALIADVVHVAAASVWVGGLAFTVLALLLAGADRWPLAARAVPVFSILAVASVVTLIAAGTLRGYQEVRAFHGLWDTTYGVLLLVKIGIVLPILALGAYNNRFAVPRLKRQIASATEQRRFLRMAGAELALMVAIVSVTAVLVTEPPAKASVKPAKYVTDTVPIGNLEVNYIIEPAKTGPNVIHLYFFTRAGVPANVDDAKLSATLPSKGLGPVRIPLQRIVPSHYTTPAGVFPQPGEWQVTIEARRGEFEALTQTVTVPSPCADEADKAASLAVYNEIWPLDAVTLDEVHSFESGATAFADFIAPGGSAWVGVMPWRPGIGQVLVTILPAHRGRGLGTAFYERVSAWLREHEVDTIDAPIPEDDERSIAFAAKRGFEEVERNGRMLLELTAREPDPVAPPEGVEIVTWAERPDLVREIYDVACEAFPDVPGDRDHVMESFEDWLEHDMKGSGDLPEATFLAVSEDEVVGYSKFSLTAAQPTTATHDMTGVKRAWRRRGIAAALKRAQIAWARERGYELLATQNEMRNEPMRKLNERLGYRPAPGRVVMRGPLA